MSNSYFGRPVRNMTNRSEQQLPEKSSIETDNKFQDQDDVPESPGSRAARLIHRRRRHKEEQFRNFLRDTEEAWDADDDNYSKMLLAQATGKLSLEQTDENAQQESTTVFASNGENSRLVETDELAVSEDNESVSSRRSSTSVKPERSSVDDVAVAQSNKLNRFKDILSMAHVDLDELKKLSWNGIPDEFRAMTWQLLMGYLPSNEDRRASALARKRQEYWDCVHQYFLRGGAKGNLDKKTYQQIHIDVPRTSTDLTLFQRKAVQQCFERVLYIWAMRHPASGYVQGINDLLLPFFTVFLSPYINVHECRAEEVIPDDILRVVEADCFGCLSRLLDGIQDNYTFGQPGIQRQLVKLQELVGRIDVALSKHFQKIGLEFVQFAFRWMNCLLVRELSLDSIIRMWDTYQAEEGFGFADFHLYVCAAFLCKWSEHLRNLDFQEAILFLQGTPAKNWSRRDVELLLSEAYMWKSMFHHSPYHLSSPS